MKEAMFYEKLDRMKVQCHLCPNECIILHGKRGSCRVRENRAGVLYSLVYGLPCTASVDPVEKKPLFHFLPGTLSYSIATPGCNLHCRWCQNWQISQRGPDEVPCFEMSPEKVVNNALKAGCKSISYTYVEPSIFYEYVLDTAKLARKAGLKNIMVTNGYLNQKPVKELYRYIDACNVDLKGFTEEFYRDYCSGHLKPVLEMIKTVNKMGVWVELTTLIVPGLNDSPELMKEQCDWIRSNVGDRVPLHLSRFFPYYKLAHLPPTPPETLEKAYGLAKDVGLKYVYVGNIQMAGTEDTSCPKCGRKLIERSAFFTVSADRVKDGKCFYCGAKVDGVFSSATKPKTKKPAAKRK
ncbi:AmmeMemoRadiSam system radical SAM enzyme [Candidatus Woesearchaeota archaeon]|nr:AmmeMemoRadiSam system radical SAM enzyme [Candidatus Woesearchaeota archaeon]